MEDGARWTVCIAAAGRARGRAISVFRSCGGPCYGERAMTRLRSVSACTCRALTPALFLALAMASTAALLTPACAQSPETAEANPALAAYREHLAQLDRLVATCRKLRTQAACAPSQVGPDDKVPWPEQGKPLRAIRYDWLRELLERASSENEQTKPGSGPAQGSKAAAPTIDALLAQAQQRLQDDASQAKTALPAAAGHAAERNLLAAILAQRAYRGVTETTSSERAMEWIDNWLNALLERLIGFGSRSPWIGFALWTLFLGALCVALVWLLIQIERRSRLRLLSEAPTAPGAPSAREWQLWLEDARNMAAQQSWREAIHFLYWAVIARLESRSLWPADRARTPREYLRLLPGAHPQREELMRLTRSFERTWYGGREAGMQDYQAAVKLAAELGVE